MSPPRPFKSLCAALVATALLCVLAGAAQAAPGDPLFTFSPKLKPPPPSGPPPPPIPPPTGYLNGPCGLAVDSGGRFYIADHYHDRVDVYDGAADYVGIPPSTATAATSPSSPPPTPRRAPATWRSNRAATSTSATTTAPCAATPRTPIRRRREPIPR